MCTIKSKILYFINNETDKKTYDVCSDGKNAENLYSSGSTYITGILPTKSTTTGVNTKVKVQSVLLKN